MNDTLEIKQRFAAALSALFKTFNRPVDKDISKILFHTLEHLSIEDAEKCIELAIVHGDSFPIPSALKKYVSMIPPKELPRIQYNHKVNSELAADATKLITLALEGKLTEKQLIEGMSVMDRKYPNIGWGHEAALLVGYYNSRDLAEGMGVDNDKVR